jgi:hypothetical protein
MRRAMRAWMVAVAFFTGAASAQQLDFQLIGGGAVGDGGAAVNANLSGASDAVFDGAGNLYVSQFMANRIRKITPGGVITTVVGGSTGFGGDGGPASAAKIDKPQGLAIDASGNLYFSDTGNRRVRRINTAGTISTVAGNGARLTSGDNGLAVQAGFASVGGLAVDATGNLYVADGSSHRVRKVRTDGVIVTVAGTGVAGYAGDNGAATNAQLNQPAGIDVDAAGNLFIADKNNSAIRKVSTTGTMTTVFARAIMFPINVAVDASGAVYTGDINECTLLRWNAGTVTKVAGTANTCGYAGDGGMATSAVIGAADGIDFDASGNVFFVDADAARVRRVAAGFIATVAGTGGNVADGSAAMGAPLSAGFSVAVESDGGVVFADALLNKRIRRITPAGALYTLAGNGQVSSGAGCASMPCPANQFAFIQPWGVAIDGTGAALVSDRAQNKIYSVGTNGWITPIAGQAPGTGIGDNGPAGNARIDPYGIARDAAGDLYIADHNAHRIRRINAGTITTVAGTGVAGWSGDGGPATSAQLNEPLAIAVDGAGNIYFSEDAGMRVRKIAPGGMITTIAGNGAADPSGDGGPAFNAAVGRVHGIAVDATGIYLSSEGTLRRIAPNGTIETLAGWTHYATGLAIRNGQLYIATEDGRVYRAALSTTSPPRVAHDYDGDGHSDIAWRNPQSGANVIWKAANSATTQTVMGVSNPAWKIVGQGDFDADGKSDLVWRNDQNGVNAIWRSADYTSQIAVVGVTNLAWSIEGVGDFDGDGASDLFWRNPASGQNVVWHSANAADQTVLTPVGGNAWQVVGVGDFDGDNKSDLLWRNVSTGMNSIWRSGNAATPQAMTGVTNLAWKIQGVGDFDGDGKSDVFFRNTDTGANVIWNSANAATQRVLVGVTSPLWRVVATGDYDGDGKADLLWRNTGNGSDVIWRSGDPTLQQAVTAVTNVAWTIVPYENQP